MPGGLAGWLDHGLFGWTMVPACLGCRSRCRHVLGWHLRPLHPPLPACRFAREIAELKTRLAEKDAALMGGFGDLDQLRRGELPPPDTAGLGPHGGLPQTPPPPGMIMPNHQQARQPSGSPSTGSRPPLQRMRSEGGSRGGTPPTGERAGSAGRERCQPVVTV